MTNRSEAFLEQANRALSTVLQAQQDHVVATMRMEETRATRDQAIIDAAALGFPRRALAEATSLTPGRVQQIVDLARDRPELQPALKMERERRQRSQALTNLLRDRNAE